ncbi:MAG: hypothetical protein KA978_03880 [Deltaproteobacteria bacterium]|jgi:arachidonate 15-lipoxygenase|nr:hypothetical protein [Deltaproteobacteria bacterium]
MAFFEHSPPGPPTLPQHDQESGAREQALDLRRDNYRFVYDWPAEVATSSWLPEESEYSKEYERKLLGTYARVFQNFAALAATKVGGGPIMAMASRWAAVAESGSGAVGRSIFTGFRAPAEAAALAVKPDDWRAYGEIFQTWERPDIADRVDDPSSLNDAMAWQRVAGVNPTVLRRCTRLPEGFAVTEAHYRIAMGDGDRLAAAMAEGRLFIADYSALDGLACGVSEGRQKYLAAPRALYAVDRRGRLRSVAVQCGLQPDRYPVVTPADGWHWRMANLCVQVADANHHEASAHLGRTHMVMEAVAVAMKRELAPQHPIAVLLEPHIETTLAINHSAKTSLIAPGGTVDQAFALKIRTFGEVVRDQVSSYSIRHANPAADLAARGLDDREALPEHPYREDVLPVWGALRDHADAYVRLYYAEDAQVQADTELAGFVRALGSRDGGRLHDVPAVATVDDLVGLVTTFLFIATAQHSAVNFPQFRFMGYMPNMAGALFAPVPTAETPNTEAAFSELLPPTKTTNSAVAMVYVLSDLQVTTLGHYGLSAFSDLRVIPLIARFRSALGAIDDAIAERDAARWLPYPYLRPSRILQSIAV